MSSAGGKPKDGRVTCPHPASPTLPAPDRVLCSRASGCACWNHICQWLASGASQQRDQTRRGQLTGRRMSNGHATGERNRAGNTQAKTLFVFLCKALVAVHTVCIGIGRVDIVEVFSTVGVAQSLLLPLCHAALSSFQACNDHPPLSAAVNHFNLGSTTTHLEPLDDLFRPRRLASNTRHFVRPDRIHKLVDRPMQRLDFFPEQHRVVRHLDPLTVVACGFAGGGGRSGGGGRRGRRDFGG